jgi:hypothetical protein
MMTLYECRVDCPFPDHIVRELMGRVRNVVLMNVYLDLENPGGSGFRVVGYMSQVREWGS